MAVPTSTGRPSAMHSLMSVTMAAYFSSCGQVHQVIEVLTRQRPVGRDHHHRQAVNLMELKRFGIGRTGHAGQLVVQTEVVLEGGRGQGLALGLNRQAFFGLDGLVQALGQTTARHGAAGVFVDQQHLIVLHDVFNVTVEQLVRAQARVNVGQQAQVMRRVQAFAFGQQADFGEHLFYELVTGFVQLNLARFLVDLVMAFLSDDAFFFLNMQLEARNQLVDFAVQRELSSAWPEMISGVRASSMRIESTSSITAKFSSRWNLSSRLKAMLSRR